MELSTGHGRRTEVPAEYLQIADRWAQGTMHTSRYPDTHVGDPVDWSLEAHDGSWLFRFHNMEYLFSIYRAFDETREERYRELIDRLISSWVAAHPTAQPESPAWMRHTTAMRAQALAFAAGYVPATDDYVGALRQHGEFLANPENYSGAWNHGFDESLALLAVGATVADREWMDLAVRRASDAIVAMCDAQGATNEQASVYHFYVWKQFGQFEEELARCGIEPPPALRRREAIIDFLVHASQPDGRLVSVGDSLGTPIPRIAGTPLEFTASRGEVGEPPSRRVQVFDRGWAFARTGWGTERPYAEESLLTVRFGPGRAVHGHSDHTGFHYFAQGRTAVGDAGFSGYANPERRAYELNEYGHSQVVISGAGPYRPTAPTELLRYTSDQEWEQFLLQDSPYQGVDRRRTLTFVHDPECVLVHDSVFVPRGTVVARQLMHLAPSLQLTSQEGQELLHFTDEQGSLEIRQLLPVTNIDVARGTEGSLTTGWAGVGLSRHAPSAVVTSRGRVEDRWCDFLTLVTPRPGLGVDVGAGEVEVGGVVVPLPVPVRGGIDG
jgi:hypothetical protein